MTLLRSLLSPKPARPRGRSAEPLDLENLSDEQHSAVLDALEWSDLDSSKDLVKRTDAVLARLADDDRPDTAEPADGPKPVGMSLPMA